MALTKRVVLLTPFLSVFLGVLGHLGAILALVTLSCCRLKIAQDGPVVKPRALDVLSVMARSRPDRYHTCNVDVIAWAKGGECQ